jgi:hypothetical protein
MQRLLFGIMAAVGTLGIIVVPAFALQTTSHAVSVVLVADATPTATSVALIDVSQQAMRFGEASSQTSRVQPADSIVCLYCIWDGKKDRHIYSGIPECNSPEVAENCSPCLKHPDFTEEGAEQCDTQSWIDGPCPGINCWTPESGDSMAELQLAIREEDLGAVIDYVTRYPEHVRYDGARRIVEINTCSGATVRFPMGETPRLPSP